MSVGLFIYNHKEKKVKGQYIQNTVTFVSFLVQFVTSYRDSILVDRGYIEGGVYHYYMTDHLRNNRVGVNASGTVPKETITIRSEQLLLKNESAVGRFTTVDPLAGCIMITVLTHMY